MVFWVVKFRPIALFLWQKYHKLGKGDYLRDSCATRAFIKSAINYLEFLIKIMKILKSYINVEVL